MSALAAFLPLALLAGIALLVIALALACCSEKAAKRFGGESKPFEGE